MNDIIQLLSQARKQQGLSQRQLGKQLRVPQSHISAIEAGKVDLRLSTLQEMAYALNFELMLVPRSHSSVVKAMLQGDKHAERKSRWQPDKEGEYE